MLLMIDNYDSFTYNIVQYLGELGEEVRTVRNDEITLAQIEAMG
ncbi:MAG: glutamine amidotransferase-related protein, partial [Telluria sp.]